MAPENFCKAALDAAQTLLQVWGMFWLQGWSMDCVGVWSVSRLDCLICCHVLDTNGLRRRNERDCKYLAQNNVYFTLQTF